MSYDLYMLDCSPDENTDAIGERLEADPDGENPLDSAALERNRRIAASIAASPAGASTFEGDDVVEVTIGDLALQVALYDDNAAITFPYWESLDAHELTGRITGIAAIVHAETGWRMFDPQLDRVVDPARDAGEIEAIFAVGLDATRRAAGEPERPRPWWRRLLGG
jgi:hypothetical protein